MIEVRAPESVTRQNQEVTPVAITTTEHSAKAKRKIRFRYHPKHKATDADNVPSVVFLSARQLHGERGYDQYGMKYKSAAERTPMAETEHQPIVAELGEIQRQQSRSEEVLPTKSKQTSAETTFVQRVKDRVEDVRWIVGRITRGDIR